MNENIVKHILTYKPWDCATILLYCPIKMKMSKWELPFLLPAFFQSWRNERVRRQLLFWWNTLVLMGHHSMGYDFAMGRYTFLLKFEWFWFKTYWQKVPQCAFCGWTVNDKYKCFDSFKFFLQKNNETKRMWDCNVPKVDPL